MSEIYNGKNSKQNEDYIFTIGVSLYLKYKKIKTRFVFTEEFWPVRPTVENWSLSSRARDIQTPATATAVCRAARFPTYADGTYTIIFVLSVFFFNLKNTFVRNVRRHNLYFIILFIIFILQQVTRVYVWDGTWWSWAHTGWSFYLNVGEPVAFLSH